MKAGAQQSLYSSLPRRWLEVSGTLRAPVALIPGKEPQYTRLRAWKFWSRAKYFDLTQIRTLGRQGPQSQCLRVLRETFQHPTILHNTTLLRLEYRRDAPQVFPWASKQPCASCKQGDGHVRE